LLAVASWLSVGVVVVVLLRVHPMLTVAAVAPALQFVGDGRRLPVAASLDDLMC
jgi:hypothetical protein